MTRSTVNPTVGELDAMRRLEDARRELGEIANALISGKTSKRDDRHEFGRRLNATRASLLTASISLFGEES